MSTRNEQTVSLCGSAPLRLKISYSETDAVSPANEFEIHRHEACEIYLNLSGDVSFAVEDTLYPIVPGSVILTRPGEAHRCIYRSNRPHRHYWMLLEPNGNEALLDMFYGRRPGAGNLILLNPTALARAAALCERVLDPAAFDGERFSAFFAFLQLLREGDTAEGTAALPHDVQAALEYIRDHLSSPFTVGDVAVAIHSSVNTVERHFAASLGLSPKDYIRRERLNRAARMLSGGKTVQQISDACGFACCSHFISLFKKQYGVTPLQYRKSGKE